MTTLWRLLSAALCAGAFAFAGCGNNGNGTATAPATSPAGSAAAPRHIIIGIVAKSVSNPVFQAAHAGARDAAKELGPKYNADVTVNIQTPPTEDATKQSEAIDSLVRLGASGIAVSCSEANTLTPAIDRAVASGVPVVCFDSDAPKSKRFAFYGTDDAACGHHLMDLMAKELNGKGVVAILAGSQAAPNLRARVDAVREEMKKYPNISEISIGAVYHEETPAKAAERLQEVQRANPNINGWMFIGGWPLFTRDALPWSPGDVKVVSVDALPPEIRYLEDGHVQVLLAQDCYGWGYQSVKLLLDKIVDNKEPEHTKVIDPLQEVTKANAAEWFKKWDKWLAQ